MITALPKTFEAGIRSIHDDPQMALGEYYHSNDLAIHTTYVRFAEAVDVGDPVRTKYALYSKTNLSPIASGGSAYAAAGSMQIQEHDATYLTSLAGVPPKPDHRDSAEITIVGGAGIDQHGVIQDYSNKILNILWYSDATDTKGQYTTGQLTTALDTTTDYSVTAPWYVEKATGGIGVVNGVSLVKAKKDQYGLIIWCGEDFVKVGGTVAAGDPLYIPATGAALKAVESAINAPFATVLFGPVSINGIVRAQIYANPISIVPELPRQQVRGFERPRTSIAA